MVGSIKQRSSHQEWRRCQETSGVTTRDIRAQNVWGKWKWPERSCGGGSCCILYIYCACLRKWQKNPVLAKNNEFTSTGVTLWGLHKLGGKEQNSESIKVPMILIIVLMRIERIEESLLCYCVNWFNNSHCLHCLAKPGKHDCEFHLRSQHIPAARNSPNVCTTPATDRSVSVWRKNYNFSPSSSFHTIIFIPWDERCSALI